MVPICGTPEESRTTPVTEAWFAPWRGAAPRPISRANNARLSLRKVTDFCEMAASLANSTAVSAARILDLKSNNPDSATRCILFHDKRCRLRNLLFRDFVIYFDRHLVLARLQTCHRQRLYHRKL